MRRVRGGGWFKVNWRAVLRRRGVRRNKLRVSESGVWCIPTVFRIKSFGYMPFTLRPGSLSRIIRGNYLILRKFPVGLPSWTLTSDRRNRGHVRRAHDLQLAIITWGGRGERGGEREGEEDLITKCSLLKKFPVDVLPPQNGIERDTDDSNCHNQNYLLSTNARYFPRAYLEESHVIKKTLRTNPG